MKHGLFYILLLFLLFSCGRQQEVSAPVQSDSVKVVQSLYRKIWRASTLDSARLYADSVCNYLPSKGLNTAVAYVMACRCMEWNKFEQALAYFHHVDEGVNSWMQETMCHSMPEAYAAMGRYRDAIRCLDSIRDCRVSRTVIPHYSLAKGNIYAMAGQADSASYYYEMASHSLNRWVAHVAARRLGYLNVMRGKDSLAYGWTMKAHELLYDEIQKEASAESRDNYEKEKMQNELNQLKIEKQRQKIVALSLGLSVILILFAFYFVWQRRKRQVAQWLLQEKTTRLEQAQQLLAQAEELAFLREKESQLRESLFRRMKSFHKIPSLEESREEKEDCLRIDLSEEEWKDIRQTVDKSYDNFTRRLQQRFPSLSEKDVNFCCLVKIGVSIKDLSDIYCISRTSVSRKKQRMKKDKLGLTAEDETLDSFLRHF